MAEKGLRQRGQDSWEAWVWSPVEGKKIRRTFSDSHTGDSDDCLAA
jgi:hypothetical protein